MLYGKYTAKGGRIVWRQRGPSNIESRGSEY